MEQFDPKKYITDERAKGTPDTDIYSTLQKRGLVSTPREPSSRGFTGNIAPTITAVAGGVIGGGMGALAGGVGAIPGAVAGAALGGAVGETFQQSHEEVFGDREGLDTGQIAAAGVTSAAGELVGHGIGKALAVPLKATANVVRPRLVKIMAATSGYADEVIERALERTSGAVEAVREGEPALNDIVKQSATKFSTFARESLLRAKQEIAEIAKTESLGGPGKVASRNMLLQEGRKFIQNIDNAFRTAHNIGVSKLGKLNFTRGSKPSAIISKADQNAVQEAYTWLRSIQKNTSIEHIDAVFERIVRLKTKTPAGTPSGPETKTIIGEILDEATKFVETTYPKYSQVLKQNLETRLMINEAKEIFGSTAHPTPKDVAAITKQLLRSFNSGDLPIRESVEALSKKIGTDPIGAAAGALVKAGDQISVRAPNLVDRNIIMKAVEFLPRVGLMNYIKTGQVTGSLLRNPVVLGLAKTLKVGAKETLQMIGHSIQNKSAD